MPKKSHLFSMNRDPSDVQVQISFRLPFWYREQLIAEAAKLGVSLPTLVLETMERTYAPQPPPAVTQKTYRGTP
jgi:hypothetical protein